MIVCFNSGLELVFFHSCLLKPLTCDLHLLQLETYCTRASKSNHRQKKVRPYFGRTQTVYHTNSSYSFGCCPSTLPSSPLSSPSISLTSSSVSATSNTSTFSF